MPRMYGKGGGRLSLGTELDRESRQTNKAVDAIGLDSKEIFNDGAENSGRDFKTNDRGFDWSPEMKKQFDAQNEMNKYVEGRMNSGLEDEDI